MNNTPPEVSERAHDLRTGIPCCKICENCGMAEHKTQYEGFKYWLGGIGYHEQPKCK